MGAVRDNIFQLSAGWEEFLDFDLAELDHGLRGKHLQGEVAARGLAAAKLRYFRLLFEAILHDLGLAHASG